MKALLASLAIVLAFCGGLIAGESRQSWIDQLVIDGLRSEVEGYIRGTSQPLTDAAYTRLQQCVEDQMFDANSNGEGGVNGVVQEAAGAVSFWGYIAGTTRTAKFEAHFDRDGTLLACKKT
jgi:hypothetical protein